MMNFIYFIKELFAALFAKPEEVVNLPMNQDTPITPPTPPISPVAAPNVDTLSPWTSTANNRHNVRVLCDEMGLTITPTELVVFSDGTKKYFSQKDIITACIYQESRFDNHAVGRNRDKNGNVTSTDWGLVQVNDYWNIGKGKYWSSVDQVLNNPEKAVRWMITCYKQGKLTLWSSYKTGAYKRWLGRV